MQNPELALSGVDFTNGNDIVAVGRYGLIEKLQTVEIHGKTSALFYMPP